MANARKYKYCEECGNKVSATAKFCSSCGNKLSINHAKSTHDKEEQTGGRVTNILIVVGIICTLIVAIAAVCVWMNRQKDYYSDEYAEDFNWYMSTCSDVFKDSYKSTTLLFCDCGYYEFRNKYGDKKIYGELSVSDVLGMGVNLNSDKDHEAIKDDELIDNIKACYDSEVEAYKKAHPKVDINKQWKDDEKMIVPRRMLGDESW